MSNQRILAEGCRISNDTRATGLNNNDVIIGPTGAGKTRGYVQPNMMQCTESMIIADTKGHLVETMRPFLILNGYSVMNIDFTDTANSYGYNPLDFVRYDAQSQRYNEQDILTVVSALAPNQNQKDPYWDHSARQLLSALVGYVLECLPMEEHTLAHVVRLFNQDEETLSQLFAALAEEKPNSFAITQYRLLSGLADAKTTRGCVRAMVGERLHTFSFNGPQQMFTAEKRIDFASLGRSKTAVFLTISDTDRSMDKLANLFYTQALHTLCDSADKQYRDHALPVPVRFYLDDFATNVYIPDFDRIISVIRSRNIAVSVILQSISQLDTLYGHSAGMTILNNCDNCLYLGGQDVETARYISVKANRTVDTILNMPIGDALLFTRGSRPRHVHRFDVSLHDSYEELQETSSLQSVADDQLHLMRSDSLGIRPEDIGL